MHEVPLSIAFKYYDSTLYTVLSIIGANRQAKLPEGAV